MTASSTRIMCRFSLSPPPGAARVVAFHDPGMFATFSLPLILPATLE
jgi:hypothetical protein